MNQLCVILFYLQKNVVLFYRTGEYNGLNKKGFNKKSSCAFVREKKIKNTICSVVIKMQAQYIILFA